ncbi:MAG: PAS domain S-box protein [Alphaproteobacteria bacterium]|nr:PAS domain S-box protein [Alphaproteobacteria bacterium]
MSNIEGLIVPGALRKTTARILFGAVAVIAMMVLVSAIVLWNSHDQMHEAVSHRLQTAATYNEQSLTRTLESIDGALERVSIGARDGNLEKTLDDVLRFSPHLRQILVIDDKGRIVADTAKTFYDAEATNAVDLEDLGIAKTGMKSLGSRMRIGKGIAKRFIGPASGVGVSSTHWLLPIALLGNERGGPGVHVVAAINPTALTPNLDAAVFRDHGEAAITLLDGSIILSNAALQGGLSAIRTPRVPAEISARYFASEAGVLAGTLPQKPSLGLIAYQVSPVYPIAVVVAATDQDIFDGWAADNLALLLIAISIPFVSAALIAVFGIQAIQKLRLDEGVRALSRVVEQSPASLIITDPTGKILYVTAAFTNLFGYEPGDATGQTPRLLKSGGVGVDTYNELWQTLKQGGVWHGELVNKSKGGALKWVDAIVFGVSVHGGGPDFFAAIETDITLKKEYEERLIREKMRAEAANIAKMQFLSSMSHELRTPLNAILGFGQVLAAKQKDPLSKGQREGLDMILKNGEHLLDLVNEVLDLAQIDAGNVELAPKRLNVTELLTGCQSIMGPQAGGRDIALTLNVPAELEVWADPPRLRQVILNLLSNAVKYNRAHGEVHVGAQAGANGMVRISVRDTGAGIPPELQDMVFEPFNRLGKENSNVQGTGIGLNICRDLITAMGGSIDFESGVGVGSTFWIDVPAREPGTP